MLPFFSSSTSSASSCFADSSPSLSSSSSSSLLAIKYINRGDYPEKFDYAVWKLGLFLCSEVKLPSTGKYFIECNWTNNVGGTTHLPIMLKRNIAIFIVSLNGLLRKRHLLMKSEAERRSWHQVDSGVSRLIVMSLPVCTLVSLPPWSVQKMKLNGLDGFLRSVKKEEARPAPSDQLLSNVVGRWMALRRHDTFTARSLWGVTQSSATDVFCFPSVVYYFPLRQSPFFTFFFLRTC